jgi:hypothetical protein
MINVVYNRHMLAIPRRMHFSPGSMPVDPYELFGTPYGMFIPFTTTGVQFVRWVKKGMVDVLPRQCVMSYFMHVSNSGEVLTMVADTEESGISMMPYVSDKFALMSGEREITEAYNAILPKCTTIGEAIRVVDEGEPRGIYDPILFMVEDWVNYAKEKGYTETFYLTEFPKDKLEPLKK